MDIDDETSVTWKGEDEVTCLQCFQFQIANISKWFMIPLCIDRRECGKRHTKVAHLSLVEPLTVLTPHVYYHDTGDWTLQDKVWPNSCELEETPKTRRFLFMQASCFYVYWINNKLAHTRSHKCTLTHSESLTNSHPKTNSQDGCQNKGDAKSRDLLLHVCLLSGYLL